MKSEKRNENTKKSSSVFRNSNQTPLDIRLLNQFTRFCKVNKYLTGLTLVFATILCSALSTYAVDFEGSVRDVVILGKNSVELKENSVIQVGGSRSVGDIVVTQAQPGNKVEQKLGVTSRVMGNDQTDLVANSIEVKNSAVVEANVWYADITNKGTIFFDINPRLVDVTISDLPLFPSVTPGSIDVTVPPGGNLTISSLSDYDDIFVKD